MGFIDCNEKMIDMENADINTIVITMCVSHIGSVFIITNSPRFKLYRSNRIESNRQLRCVISNYKCPSQIIYR